MDHTIKTRPSTRQAWEEGVLAESQKTQPHRAGHFETLSGQPIADLYTPDDIADLDFDRDIGYPGQYPFTRGPHASMYRGRLWTIRQVAGFGTAEDTNQRYKYLLAHGETGLSTDFDLPTLLGRDSDHAFARAEIGKVGVAISTLRDAELLWEGIPLDQISTSMTVTAPASVLIAMYEAVGNAQGVASDRLMGTAQNDILKEYTAQNEYIFPPEPAVRLVVDSMEYCAKTMPRFNTVSVSGYHIREAGATAAQELAFTLLDGFTYAQKAVERGMDVDSFAPRLSFFFDLHIDFFEEIAKLRAARRIWARLMRERLKARNPHSWRLRTHCQTAGVSLTAQQIENNIVRTTIEAMAGVLGGTQSLHTNSMDEAYQIPSEKAIKIAVRTQQIIAEESGIADVVDPLAGSYYVERLTSDIEEETWEIMRQVEDVGGMIHAIEQGYVQQQIANSSYEFQQKIESGQRAMIGMNRYVEEESGDLASDLFFQIDPEASARQIARLQKTRAERNSAEVNAALDDLRKAASGSQNTMPAITRAVRAYASIGEICDVLRDVFGEYHPPSVF
jgi:methylmalonyl-CoA mutase N-terminal domain/subunit